MSFAEQPPSQHWAVLKYRGDPFAEVWFKPDGEPFALTFRIPQPSFQIPGLEQRLTTENLLKAVGIAAAEVETWHHEVAAPSERNEAELSRPLPPPPPEVPHLTLHVRLKPPPQTVAAPDDGDAEIPESQWQNFDARWLAILGLEQSLDSLRISLESLRAELEAAARKTLNGDEKLHARNEDVAQWTRAKSRVQFTVPKAREYIHRSVWAVGTPERKKLEELYKDHIRPRLPFPQMDHGVKLFDNLFKDRQVLSAHGVSVYQECRSVLAEVQGALRRLQSNAAANASKKRGPTGPGGKW